MKFTHNTILASIFLLIASYQIHAVTPQQIARLKGKRNKIICITIPKSGTHLLYKCLKLFNLKGFYHPEKKGVSVGKLQQIRRRNTKLPPYHYRGPFHIPTVGRVPKNMNQKLLVGGPRSVWEHWPYTPESEALFNKHSLASFFMIRDPRDQLVSMAYMVHKNKNGKSVPLKTAMLDLIDGRQSKFIPWAVEIQATHPLMWELGVVGFYKLYLPWMNAHNFYTVKYENLVGELGGGSDEAQKKEFLNIARHLNVTLSSKDINRIKNQLYGGTLTFREGKIGSWRKHFTPEIKKAFKKTPGANRLLIDLGYETNADW